MDHIYGPSAQTGQVDLSGYVLNSRMSGDREQSMWYSVKYVMWNVERTLNLIRGKITLLLPALHSELQSLSDIVTKI